VRAPDRSKDIWYDPARLEAWTLQQLESLDAVHDWLAGEMEERQDWSSVKTSARAWRLDMAKLAARRDNLTPLRKLYPEIAEFIQAPRRARGQHRVVADWEQKSHRMQLALEDVQRIRRIWRRHLGKSYRRDDPTAETIAARRHGLTVSQLVSFRKNMHRNFGRH
jgi:hypothetical protein